MNGLTWHLAELAIRLTRIRLDERKYVRSLAKAHSHAKPVSTFAEWVLVAGFFR
jgi:hypothetical protein